MRVLDPACGSGNFLYVTLEHLKRLEGEVLLALDELGYRQTGLALDGERADAAAGETVDPHNLLGIELNPRAAAIAEVVLWIGYLQWHFRTRGDVHPPQPVVRDFRNIENRDAVLAYDSIEYVRDARGIPVTRWDGETMKLSPVTGEKIPDETARQPLERYVNPRKAAWPEADFVVGNPPFIGNKRMRAALGDGYVEALRGAWPDMPDSADFVMYWWHHAAQLTRRGALERFGFITTNSIRQSFNRRVIEAAMAAPRAAAKPSPPTPSSPRKRGSMDVAADPPSAGSRSTDERKEQPLSLVFAIPDHPWVDTADGAAVRIAMTVGDAGDSAGRVLELLTEKELSDGEVGCEFATKRGRVHADLRAGLALVDAPALIANRGLAFTGMYPLGQGFVVLPEQRFSAVGHDASTSAVLKPFVTARDLTQKSRNVLAIDFYPRDAETARRDFPSLFQWVLDRVKPERDQNPVEERRNNWWLFTRPVPPLRRAVSEISRYIVVPRTAKWFTFQFVESATLPDTSVVAIASDDSLHLGVLSSAVHLTWAIASGGRLGVGNDTRYQHQRTFNPFPFPAFTEDTAMRAIADRIRNLAEQLDAHRKRQQVQHPGLTLTGMYNVLDALRGGEPLTARERVIHEQGLVSVLRQLHDELDEAVLYAYGWGDLLPLLRVAHGNDAPVSLLPLAGEGARRADDGARDDASDASQSRAPSPQPSPASGRGSQANPRDDARRAFDETILERLVALNAQRAAAEARGEILWLRPEFQNPAAGREPEQRALATTTDQPDAIPAAIAATKPAPWPKDTVYQVRAVADLLAASPIPLSIDEIAARFTARGPWKKRLPKLLEMLIALGMAQEQDGKVGMV